MGSTAAETFYSSINCSTFHSFPLKNTSITSPAFSLLKAGSQASNWVKKSVLPEWFFFNLKTFHVEFYFSRKMHPKNSLYLIQHEPTKLCHCHRAGHNPKISQQFGHVCFTAKQNMVSICEITLLNILLAPALFYPSIIFVHCH